jgi:hypothetical protein
MTEAEATVAFSTMTEKQQGNVREWHRKNPGMTFAQVVAMYYVKSMPSGNPDEAIAPNTEKGKMRRLDGK